MHADTAEFGGSAGEFDCVDDETLSKIRSMIRVLRVAVLVSMLATPCVGRTAEAPVAMMPVDACIAVAADAFGIDALPLKILHRTEAGREGLAQANDDGSVDLGPMQINSVHLGEFARFGIDYEDLRDNRGCANVLAAAYLFKRHLVAERGDVAMAIADYHSRNPRLALRYLGLVQQAIAAERRDLARHASAASTGDPPP